MTHNSISKILTIDDERAVRESIVDFLEDLDYEVAEAENGAQGLEVFAAAKPDLVLVDLRMPVLSGLEVLAEIAADSPDTPVIVISGAGDISDVVEALRLGAVSPMRYGIGAWSYPARPGRLSPCPCRRVLCCGLYVATFELLFVFY